MLLPELEWDCSGNTVDLLMIALDKNPKMLI